MYRRISACDRIQKMLKTSSEPHPIGLKHGLSFFIIICSWFWQPIILTLSVQIYFSSARKPNREPYGVNRYVEYT